MTEKIHIGIILLAAGDSSRMKQNKLMLKVKGKTLLENALVGSLQSSADKVILVTGAYEKEISKIIEKHSVETIHNTNWEKGIGSSIKCGLQKALADNPGLNAVIISVCDQPFLTKEVFDGLINIYIKSGKKIIVSAYSRSIGVPVLYDKRLFSELLRIPDRYGAKKYIIDKAPKHIIATFPFPKGEIDIDTMEDLKNLAPP